VQVIHSSTHLRHDPAVETEHGFLVAHHELPARAERVIAALTADPTFTINAPRAWGTAPIEAVHEPGLVRFLSTAWDEFQRAVRSQRDVFPDVFMHDALRVGMEPLAADRTNILGGLAYWCFEMATPIVAGSYEAARAAVDVALSATEIVLGGERAAFGNCRPPGHHAPRAAYGGFCYFNNAAIAAHHVASTTGARVTVLDVDYHHGNGTQQIFYERDDVQYVSLHGDPARAYPYIVGFADECGAGRGRGHNINLPLAEGTNDADYLRVLDQARAAIDAFDPALIVVSLGLDTYCNDPISDLALTANGFEACGRAVAALDRPTVVLLEGGYDIDALGENVRRWLRGLAS